MVDPVPAGRVGILLDAEIAARFHEGPVNAGGRAVDDDLAHSVAEDVQIQNIFGELMHVPLPTPGHGDPHPGILTLM